jgi:hypothetical protein
MPPKNYDCARDRLEGIFNRELCSWCKYPYKKIHRAGLCRHCYSLKTELRQTYRTYLARKAKSRTHDDMFMPEYNLRVAINMAEAAQIEGRVYGELDKVPVSNLELEHAFGLLSRKFLHKNLYHHDAFLFECFSASQKQYLMYIISRMIREHSRRHRRTRVVYDTGTLRETLKNRARGTYRVEDDVKL